MVGWWVVEGLEAAVYSRRRRLYIMEEEAIIKKDV